MPSDMAKLFLTASLAKDFSKKQVVEYTPINLIVIILKVGITCFLIMLSNFSTSVLVFGSSLVLMFFGRVPYKHIGSIIVVFVSMVGIVVMLGLGQRAQTIQSRIKNFLERRETSKELNIDKKQGEDYQITRSLYAIATGGKSPKGPGKSQQKYFLSQAESDFIFAIIIEEYGIVAAICIPLLFLLLLYRGAKSLQESMAPFGGLLAAGLTSSIVFQAFINMFVSVDAGPVTGQPMPMISAGGTSLIFTAMSIGLILAVSEDKKKQSKLKEV
jgi:cell division protein FtsW